MKRLSKKLLGVFFSTMLITSLSSCGPSQQEYDALLEEKKELQKEITLLKTEIENYKNTPDKLYAEVLNLVESKDISSISGIYEKLVKYHPSSVECINTKELLQKLIDEKEAKEKAEKAKRMQAVNKLKKKYDDVSGITWYHNPYFTHYDNVNRASLYIGQNESKIWLRLKMSYEGDNWIFFEKAYLSYDGKTKEIFFNEYNDKETDNGYGGRVWEWIDISVDDALLAYLKNMVNGNSLKMRLSGKYTHTHNITGNEKKALEDVLLAYDVLINEQK